MNQESFVQNLRIRHIGRSFPEGYTGKRDIHVVARPINRWDASTVQTMHHFWSSAVANNLCLRWEASERFDSVRGNLQHIQLMTEFLPSVSLVHIVSETLICL